MNTNPEETVEVEPQPVGLPRSLALLSSVELSAKLREWKQSQSEEKPDDES